MSASCMVMILAAALGQTADLTYVDSLTTDLVSPARLATAPGGGVYVTDQSAGQVLAFDGTGALVGTYAIPEQPVGIGVIPSTGEVVISRLDGVVGIYDASFVLQTTLDPAPMTLTQPNDIAIHPVTEAIYVADSAEHRIMVFNPTTGALVQMFGMEGSGLGQFQSPQAIAIDAARDRIIVADVDNFRVQVFDMAGTVQFKFGYRTLYTGSGQVAWMARSEGLALDSCGNIYLADALMGTVRAFSPSGKELDSNFDPLVTYGAAAGELRIPCDIVIDGSDRLYVASSYNASVEVFDVTCATVSLSTEAGPAISSNPISGGLGKPVKEVAQPTAPDNPYDIVVAMNAGTYVRKLDLNRDRSVDIADLEIAVEGFGAATVEDFLNMGTGLRDTYPGPILPPHMIDIDYTCGRCHSMNGLPGGMLTVAGQENLCLSCHTASGRAMNTVIASAPNHPLGVPAASGDVEGPNPDSNSEMIYHLDNGNIRCATCHDPHEQDAGEPYLRASVLNASLCGECHRDEGAQWAHAGHADVTADPWSHYDWALPSRAACRHCHSGYGFIDYSKDVAQNDRRGEFRVLDCAVCHGVHGVGAENLLREFGEVVLPGDVTVTDAGASATCMVCHNGRTVPADGGTPHYALAGVMLEGINGNTFGETLTNSPHTFLAQCTDCHMAPGPADGQPGAGKVGGHTFAMKVHDAGDPDFGYENVGACNTPACHGGGRSPELLITEFNREAFGDYDGDGTVEGVQDEVQGLMELVYEEITTNGAVFLGHYPYWDYTGVVDDPPGFLQTVKDVVWNWEYVDNSGDLGIHNTGYAVGLLQVSYKALTGMDIPGATLRYDAPIQTLPETVVEIVSVNGGAPVEPGQPFSVDFTIEDETGTAIPRASLNRLVLYVSGPAYNYQKVIPSDSTSTNFTQNPDDSYTYAIAAFPTVYSPPDEDSPDITDGELTGQALLDGTYTVAVESRQSFGSIRKAGDDTMSFVVANDPLNPPALDARELVTQDACNACHNELQLHGGNRKDVIGCLLCHTAGAEDMITDPVTTPGLTVKFDTMIHQLHRGHDLPNVTATANSVDPWRYIIIGHGASENDFSHIGFPILPGAISDCASCHAGAPDGGQIYTNVTRAACVGCHNDLDFTVGTILDKSNADVQDGLLTAAQLSDPAYRVRPGTINHTFPDDSTCNACHGPGATWDVEAMHKHPTEDDVEGTDPMVEIVSVGGMTGGGGTYFQPGDFFEVTFKLMDDNSNPLELVDGDSGVIDRLDIIFAGPTSLYQLILPAQSPWSGGTLRADGAHWFDNFAVDGTYTFISEDPIPADFPAPLNALGKAPAEQIFPYEGGWGQLYTPGGTPLAAGTYSVIMYGRRLTPTDGEREPLITTMYDAPLGAAGPIVPYVATADTASCNACHGVLAFHGNQRYGIESCVACHAAGAQNVDTYEGIDMRIMTHKLHNAQNLWVVQQGGAYELHGHSGIADFSDLLISSMPGEAAECQVCHVTDAWKNPPLRDNMRTWMVACTSCHDAPDTKDHADAATIAGTFTETCTACHGPGTPWSVEAVHMSP